MIRSAQFGCNSFPSESSYEEDKAQFNARPFFYLKLKMDCFIFKCLVFIYFLIHFYLIYGWIKLFAKNKLT